MSCPHQLRSMALADGQLHGIPAVLARWHLRRCARCQAQQGEIELMKSLHRPYASTVIAPPHLRARILSALDAETMRPTAPATATRQPPDRGFRTGFLTGAVTAGVISVAVLLAGRAGTEPGDALVADHIAALRADALVQMPSGDRHTVRPWLARHADVSPPVPDLAANGFKLLGGRTVKLAGVQVAVVSYQYHQHVIDLYAGTTRWKQPADTRRGYELRCWRTADLSRCAVSDVADDVLETFVRLQRGTGDSQTEDR